MRKGMARKLGRTALLLGAAALSWAASATLFTVDVTEYGIVSRFGRIVRIADQPGLYLKSPLDRVLRLERRLLYAQPARAEYLTADKKNVVVRSLATWRIADPERFLRTLRSRANAEERLADMILGEIGAALGRYSFAALVSSGDGQGRFATMVSDIVAAVASSARPAFGIEVVDVDVRKLYLPDQNKQSVFERMKAERGRIAAQYRSEGERDARALIAQADAERARLMAAAEEQAQRIRSEGEAEAIRVYAEAFGQAPEFYKFLRTLEGYRKILDGGTTLFLPADAEIFGLLQFDVAPAAQRKPGEPAAEPKPDELAARSGNDPETLEPGRRRGVVIVPRPAERPSHDVGRAADVGRRRLWEARERSTAAGARADALAGARPPRPGRRVPRVRFLCGRY